LFSFPLEGRRLWWGRLQPAAGFIPPADRAD
jgi:hypothetical protein